MLRIRPKFGNLPQRRKGTSGNHRLGRNGSIDSSLVEHKAAGPIIPGSNVVPLLTGIFSYELFP